MLIVINSFILTLLIASSGRLVESKVFERCELAKVLHRRHRLDLTEVAQWVCIAQHSSGFNTAAQANSPTGGSHGLFQISDVYWCSPPGKGVGCNLPCQKLRNADLSDDLTCVKRIYDEHQRISGDGYTAWNVYQQHCKHNAASYILDCFPVEMKGSTYFSSAKAYKGQFSGNSIQKYIPKKTGKVYERCELARELYNKHKMPMQQIPTWVCIAEHESRFNTAAVGRLNADGSADHGLFQISDLYWCSHDRYSGGGKACRLSCSKLLDNDITDDVHCVKTIHREHTSLSGDGFNAWTVYKPYCKNQKYERIANCFRNIQKTHPKVEIYALPSSSNQIQTTTQFSINSNNPFIKNLVQHAPAKTYYSSPTYNDIRVSHKGKAYTRCSLAKQLYFKHNFPIQDTSTWVCIAEHESQLNTAALGRLSIDGSTDHGLFQINDRYWCDHNEYGGKACNIHCDKLLDDDIRDDVACIKIIYEEHTRLSGDGFNAWTVYKTHCQNQKENIEHIEMCFDEETLTASEMIESSSSSNVEVAQGKNRIYSKCELAKELYHKHHMPMDLIPKWVCIAEHESSFNTAAVGRLNADGSADHGLFQISDLYWCSHDKYGGKGCNIPCHKLLDSDISDDIRCIKIIHAEHTRISGDGFNAWTVYQPHCHKKEIEHVKECFTQHDLKQVSKKIPTPNTSTQFLDPVIGSPRLKYTPKGKIYRKCELAQELYQKHHMPMEQIPKWVCIAQHESSYNTAAVGRLNTDGSADHGLFQISDLYWCTHDQYGGKACNIPCDKLLDADITDDVKCIKIIYEEHTRISGDGFNAWTVYKPHCRNMGMRHVRDCFTEKELKQVNVPRFSTETDSIERSYTPTTKNTPKGKIYSKCELTQELLTKYKMPIDQVPTWVCIAQYESSFNTAAVGRQKVDGSLSYGLFQINDRYWCSHDSYGGKACNIPCDRLLQPDIEHDLKCIKIIYEEHTRISGNGFNAWKVYKPRCQNQTIRHISKCLSANQIQEFEKKQVFSKKYNNMQTLQYSTQKYSYKQNPFFGGFRNPNSDEFKLNRHDEKLNYAHNPFLQNIKIASESVVHEIKSQAPSIFGENNQENYHQDIFFSELLKPSSASQNYQLSETSTKSSYRDKIFLNGEFTSKPAEIKSEMTSFKNNTLLYGHIQDSTTLSSSSKNEIHKNYLNSNTFRTTTTPKAKTTPTAASFKTTKRANTSSNDYGTTKQTAPPTTTLKPITKNTEKPTTSKINGIENTPSRNPPNTTTSKISTSTTAKKAVTNKLTTKSTTTTTRTPRTTTTWKWQNLKYYNSTTTRPPKTTNTRQDQNKKEDQSLKNSSSLQYTATNWNTVKGETTKSPRTTTTKPENTTWNWRNEQKTSTVKPLTATENWRKWDHTRDTVPSTTAASVKRTTWNWRNEQKSSTIENWRKWDHTTTKGPSTTATNTDRTIWNGRIEQKQSTTKGRPLPTTANWRKWNHDTTKKPSTIATSPEKKTFRNWTNEQKSTTAHPPNTTENWRKWDRTTTKRPSTIATSPQKTTTWNWRNGQKSTTTHPPTTIGNWRKWDKITTIKTNTTTIKSYKSSQGTTNNWRSTTTAKPTTAIITITATSKPTKLENFKNSTTNHESTQTITLGSTSHKNTITRTTHGTKYENDPLSHRKVDELKRLHNNNSTISSFTAAKLKTFPNSLIYQELKNSTVEKTKTIVASNFGNSKLPTTKRPTA